MGHLLSTINPDAADRINGEGRPLPEVGSMVVFHPRKGDVRRGRAKVAAVVTGVDESNRLLELTVIYGANDLITVERVPRYVEGDRGWAPLPAQGGAAEIAELRDKVDVLTSLLLGDFQMPEGQSAMDLIDSLDERIGKVEDAKAPAAAAVVVKPAAKPKRRLRRDRG